MCTPHRPPKKPCLSLQMLCLPCFLPGNESCPEWTEPPPPPSEQGRKPDLNAPCLTLRKSIHNVLFIIPQLFLIPAHQVWVFPKAQSIAFFSPTILQLVDYKPLSVGPLTQASVLWPFYPTHPPSPRRPSFCSQKCPLQTRVASSQPTWLQVGDTQFQCPSILF